MSTKPEIEFPDGPAPTELVIKDLVVGDGAEAVPGGNVEVHYVGVEFDTGERLLRNRSAADRERALEHEHRPPRPREVRGGDQAVVPAADDDDVGVGHGVSRPT